MNERGGNGEGGSEKREIEICNQIYMYRERDWQRERKVTRGFEESEKERTEGDEGDG